MTDQDSPTGATCLEAIIPILNVRNLKASIRYYVATLGFALEWNWGEGDQIASVSRDGKAIMLCQDGQGYAGTWLWIGVDDITPLFEEFSRKGATFLEGPTNYPWAFEMKIEDPDKHVLRFGSEPRREETHESETTG